MHDKEEIDKRFKINKYNHRTRIQFKKTTQRQDKVFLKHFFKVNNISATFMRKRNLASCK